MKVRFSLGLALSGFTFLAAQPGLAANLVINDAGPDPNIIISASQFEGGFSVNGTQIQSPGLGSGSTTVSENGTFVDGAAENTFSGSWIVNPGFTPGTHTVFFTGAEPGISDVLQYTFTTTTVDGRSGGQITGFVISDNEASPLTVAALNAAGIFATDTVSEGPAGFGFGNTNLTASFQSDVEAVPESSTWAMMIIGFASLGFAAYRGKRKRNRLDAAIA